MKTNYVTRILSVVALAIVSLTQHAHAQSNVTAFGSVGISDIDVNGLGLLDLADPYIKPITQFSGIL